MILFFKNSIKEGVKHMEYVAEHGVFEDVPVGFIQQSVIAAYPHLTQGMIQNNFSGKCLLDELISGPKSK
jgi:hypothetical protein